MSLLRMSNQSSGSAYPPRSSSITQANEVLEHVNAMSTPSNNNTPEQQNIPRRFFNKVLATTSNSSRDKTVKAQAIGGAPYSNLAEGRQLATGGVVPEPSSYVYGAGKYSRLNTSSPNFLTELEAEPKGRRNSSLHKRHSSFVPLTRLYGKDEGIRSQQISLTSHERSAHSSLPQSSLAISGSRESSVASTHQSSGYINTTGPPQVCQSGQVVDCGRLEPGAKQKPPRPDTLASESSNQPGDSGAGNPNRCKLTAWSSNLKKWGFGGGESKEKDSPRENNDDQTGRKISWRKSTVDLLSAYRDRSSEERDGPFWKKNHRTEAYPPPTPEMNLTDSSIYESLNGLQQNVSAAFGLQPSSTKPTAINTQPSNSLTVGLGRSSTLPLNVPPKDPNSKPCVEYATGTNPRMELSSSPSTVSSIPSRSTSLMHPLIPVTNSHTGTCTLEDLSLDCADFDSDEENDGGGSEDETITLKTHLKMSQTGSPRKTDSLPRVRESQILSDICTIFHDCTAQLGYGTFIKLLQSSMTDLGADRQMGNGGRKCFHFILSFVSVTSQLFFVFRIY